MFCLEKLKFTLIIIIIMQITGFLTSCIKFKDSFSALNTGCMATLAGGNEPADSIYLAILHKALLYHIIDSINKSN
jgi:hypothetical protein